MRRRESILAAGVVLLAATTIQAERIWQIGRVDESWHDLAFDGNLGAYIKDFPDDVTFHLGQDDPKTQCSAHHAGQRGQGAAGVINVGWFPVHAVVQCDDGVGAENDPVGVIVGQAAGFVVGVGFSELRRVGVFFVDVRFVEPGRNGLERNPRLAQQHRPPRTLRGKEEPSACIV